MDSLRQHRAYLEAAWQAAKAAPLSRRKANVVVALIDAYIDRMFAVGPDGRDILDYRAEQAAARPALGLVMALGSGRPGMDVVAEAVAVPIADYGSLPVEDFMVSLYNDHSVQKLRLVLPDGERVDLLTLLGEAMAALGQP